MGVLIGCTVRHHRLPTPTIAAPTSLAVTTLPVSPIVTPASSATPVGPCVAAQLVIELRSVEGAAGNYAGAYWVSNVGLSPCRLAPHTTIALRDTSDNLVAVEAISGATRDPFVLTANTPLPPRDQNPAAGQTVATILLVWPTDANCPTPLILISSVRVQFRDGPVVDAHDTDLGDQRVRVCGNHIGGSGPDPLTT